MGKRLSFLFLLLLSSCKDSREPSPPPLDEGLIGVVFKTVRENYVEPVEETKLVEGALCGALEALDPFSTYFSESKLRHFEEMTQGAFGGIGLEIQFQKSGLKVVAPMDDSPAQKAGVRAGDIITHVNEEPLKKMAPYKVLEKLHGPPGTMLTLKIRRGSRDLEIKVIRGVITLKPVKWRLEGEMGYVRVSCFNDNTAKELKEALQELRASAKEELKGFVLDLRNNPGGTLEQALQTSSLFLEAGLDIVRIRKRDPRETQVHKSAHKDLLKNIPMAVLIDEGSASASEIVAGALQDHKRAILIGTKSFGKGGVQAILPITRQKQNLGALKLTIARFFTPTGKTIQDEGITPDIVVESEEEREEVSENKEERGGEQSAGNPLAAEKTAETAVTKESRSEKPPKKPKKDLPLQRALDTLKGLSIFGAKR